MINKRLDGTNLDLRTYGHTLASLINNAVIAEAGEPVTSGLEIEQVDAGIYKAAAEIIEERWKQNIATKNQWFDDWAKKVIKG